MMLSDAADAEYGACAHDVGDVLPSVPSPGRSRLVSALFCALLLSLTGACKGLDERAEGYALEAQALANKGDMLGAMQAAQKAISLRDNNANYFLLLATIQLRSGQNSAAFLSAHSALDLDAANVAALNLVANLGLQVGQMDDAADAADRILALEPNSLVGLQVKGLIQLYRDDVSGAESTAKRLLVLSPTDEAGTIIMVRVLAKQGEFQQALDLLEKAIKQGQRTPALLTTQVNLYRALGQPAGMATIYEQMPALVGDMPARYRLDQINLLYKMGRTAEARAAADALLRSDATDVDNLSILRRIWWEFDPVPFTRETIKAAAHWPNPLALVSIGRYLLWQGQPQLADDLYFAFPQSIRGIGQAIHERASLALGRADSARAGVEGILSADPDDVDALLLRGQLQAQDGNMGLATEAVQKALDTDPNDPEIYVELARLYEKTDAAWRSKQIFEDGLQQLPQNFLLIERYTQFLHQSGNKSRAVSVTRAFARALPSSVKAWTMLAQQCDWAGDRICAGEAEARGKLAAARFEIDDSPGAPPDRGLLSKF